MTPLLGTTPADPDDRGAADPRLAAALAAGDEATLWPLLLAARLLVPVVALAGDGGGEADMAVPALVRGGRRALPVFSSYDALRAWRADARPVPMTGARVVAGALAEGYDAVVVDVAGPARAVVDGQELAALADAARRLAADPTATVVVDRPLEPGT